MSEPKVPEKTNKRRKNKLELTSGSLSESNSNESSEESEQRKLRKLKNKKKNKRKNKQSSRDHRKSLANRKSLRKVSFSSVSDSTGSSMESSEWSSSSSDTSSDSSNARRSKRKHRKKNKKVRKYREKNRKEEKKHSSMKRIPVYEWRIKYDGKDQGRRLAEFLKEVKMRRKSEEISEKELFRAAIHLFSGRAKDWFMEGFENRDFRNWHELMRELKREFLPPDLDFQIEVQATSRRQARGEKFVDYLHGMQKLFQSMTRTISDRRKFEIIWRNMRFDYKNAMTGAGIKSLAELKKYGRIIDENNWNMFQKPPDVSNRPRISQVNEIFSNNSNKSTNGSANNTFNTKVYTKSKPKDEIRDNYKGAEEKTGEREEKKERVQNTMEGSAKGTLQSLAAQYKRPPIGTCYNCSKMGHHYGECPEDRRKFCRLCGFSDVYTSHCPCCQKNEQNST